MLAELDQFYLDQEEPNKACFLALKSILLNYDSRIYQAWKYKGPFFCIENKNICYLWKDRKSNQPYIGFIDGHLLDHPALETGNRKQIKILSIDPNRDIPLDTVHSILQQVIQLQAIK